MRLPVTLEKWWINDSYVQEYVGSGQWVGIDCRKFPWLQWEIMFNAKVYIVRVQRSGSSQAQKKWWKLLMRAKPIDMLPLLVSYSWKWCCRHIFRLFSFCGPDVLLLLMSCRNIVSFVDGWQNMLSCFGLWANLVTWPSVIKDTTELVCLVC